MNFTLINLCFYLILISLENEVHVFGGRTTANKKTKCLNPPRTARRVELHIKECQEEIRTKLVSEAFQILKDKLNKQSIISDEQAHDERPYEYLMYPNDYGDQEKPSSIEIETHMDTESNAKTETDSSETEIKRDYNPYKLYTVSEDTPAKRQFSQLLRNVRRTMSDLTIGIYHPTLVPFEDKRIAGCLLHCIYAKNNAIDKLGWPTLDGLVEFYSEGVNEHGFFMATLRSVNLCLHAVTQKYHGNRLKQPEGGESCDLAFDVFDCISDQITGYCLDNYKQ